MVAWNYLHFGGLGQSKNALRTHVDKDLLFTQDSDAINVLRYWCQFYRSCTTSSKKVIYVCYLNTPLKHPQTQNQFRQVVKYSIPSSHQSFEDEIDGLFFSLGYGRIFMKGIFLHGRCCSMMSNVAGPGGFPGKKPGKNSSDLLCTVVWAWSDANVMYFWKEETWVKDTPQKSELHLAFWVAIYRYMHMSNRHFPSFSLVATLFHLWCRTHHVYRSLRREVALPGGAGSDAGRWKDGDGDVMGTIALTMFMFHMSLKCHPFVRKGYDESHVEAFSVRISMSWF